MITRDRQKHSGSATRFISQNGMVQKRGLAPSQSPVEANSVFARLTPDLNGGLRSRGWKFYSFIGSGGARLMCSWDTTEDDVKALVHDIRDLLPGGSESTA